MILVEMCLRVWYARHRRSFPANIGHHDVKVRPPMRLFMLLCVCAFPLSSVAVEKNPIPVKYCRSQVGEKIAYGIVEDDKVIELDGDLFGKRQRTSNTHRLDSVKL